MALILKNEQDHYQKILIDKSFINFNGVYTATAVFRSKFERDKDKSRSPLFNEFVEKISDRFKEIDLISNESEKIEELSKIQDVMFVANNLLSFVYKGDGIAQRELTKELEEELNKYGFNRDWYEDPILVVRTDVIFLGEYNKQDFTLESFYNLLKKNIYTDKDGKLLVEDDL